MIESSFSPRRLRVFLCYSSADRDLVRALSSRLTRPEFQLWLDEIDLLPGQYWRREIPKAVHDSDVVLVCLSSGSISKRGYVQKEIKFALDAADEQPEGTIFLIPVKLEECTVPSRLSDWQWVNLYDANGFDKLVGSLQTRARELRITTAEAANGDSQPPEHQSDPDPVSRFANVPDPRPAKRRKSKTLLFVQILASLIAVTALIVGGIWLVEKLQGKLPSNETSIMHYNLGLALENQQRNPEAEIEFKQALKTNPNSPEIHTALGRTFAYQRKFVESEAEFRQAIRINPNYHHAYNALGMTMNEQKRYREAETALREALRIDPTFAEARSNLGFALFFQGRYSEAETHFRQTIAIDSRSAEPYNGLGMALREQGKYTEAASAFGQALSIYRDHPYAHNGLGLTLLAQGSVPAAIFEFREAVRLNQSFAEAHYNLGKALHSQGYSPEAEAEFKNAVRWDANYSNNADFHYLLGLSLGNQQRFGEAADEFRISAELNPNNPLAHNGMGLALAAQKRNLEADLAFNDAMRVDPNFVMAKTLNELQKRQK
ncbi:MAG TPA: tetratricopeptide repeat protein [Pyrinomonadaceae bacterium]|nr:tetratricopeptide repeat protein [Pyrinomonadaceae bacterium]